MAADIDLVMSRREALRDMRDVCTVKRDGVRTFNDTTGHWTNSPTSVYSGACRVKSPRSVSSQGDAGSQLMVVTSTEVQFPVTAADLVAGDVVEITASPDRPSQVGRKFKIIAPFDGTQSTSLRYRVEVADGR